MGPQRSVAAVIAAGFAVIVAIIIVAWVALQPRAERSATAAAPTSTLAAPSPVDETDVVEAIWTTDALPMGTDLGAARAGGQVGSVTTPADLLPDDALTWADVDGTTTSVALGSGAVLTKGNTGTPTGSSVGLLAADCPKDWTGTLPPGQRLVYVVSAPVAKGTTVAQAFAAGALRPHTVSPKYVPPAAIDAVGPVCTRVAQFDLTRGTVLTAWTIGAP